MPHSRFSTRQPLIRLVPIAAAIAMLARAWTSWGPMNLVVLSGFVLIASAVLACIPIIPHRPFWTGLAGFGLMYALIWLAPIPGFDRVRSSTDALFRGWAETVHGPAPNVGTARVETWESTLDRERTVDQFVVASHAVAALGIGLLGGVLLRNLAKFREARRWDREAWPELPLQDFMRPTLKD